MTFFFNVSSGTTCQGFLEGLHEALQTKATLPYSLDLSKMQFHSLPSESAESVPLRKVFFFFFFFVNVKFFCLPHKPVLQPFSLEMENVCLKFSQHYAFFAHRNSQAYHMGRARLF